VSKYRPQLLSPHWALPLYRDVPAGAGFLLDKPAVLGGAIKETPCVRGNLRAAESNSTSARLIEKSDL
jgi:hypothetical protein